MKKIALMLALLLALGVFSQPVDHTPAQLDSIELLLSKTKDPMKRYRLLVQLGDSFYSQRNNGPKEVKNKMEMVQLALALKNDPLISVAYNKLANYYLFTTGDFDTGTQYLYKVIPHAENTGDKDILASVYVDLANAFWFLGNPREQLRNIQKAEANLPATGTKSYQYYRLQCDACYALYYYTMNQPDKALIYTNKVEIMNQSVKSQLFELFTIIQRGGVAQKKGETAMAATYFEKAKRSDQTNIPIGNFFFNYFFIQFLIDNSHYPQAVIQSEELLAKGKKVNNKYYELTANGFLKKIYDLQNNTDRAYFYAKRELELKEAIFSQEKINKIQMANLNAEIQSKLFEEERQQNIQYAIIATGIITFFIFFLMLSRTVIVNEKWISFLAILALLLVFEFINL